MLYMINVDREVSNVHGANGCRSALHEDLGEHLDLTIHALGCQIRGARAVQRPPTRFWDDNDGQGYSFERLADRVRELRTQPPHSYARRCRTCGVEANLPEWD